MTELPTDQELRQWYPQLYRSALRMTRCPERAAEATQQACFKALSNWGKFNGQSQPVTWIYSILLNCVRDMGRNRAKEGVSISDEWEIPDRDVRQDGQADVMMDGEMREKLRTVIRDLPEKISKAFVATVLDGYSYEQAAIMLGVSTGTIASRVFQARKIVTKAMQKEFPDEVRS